MEFTYSITIRFADVDAAGIVYYPRFFHYYHSAFEEFFGVAHGTPYPTWLAERGVGFPTVHVDGDFKKPLRYGEPLEIAVTVPRIGKTSVDFAFEARSKASPDATSWNLAATSRVTKVCTSMDDLTPREIPQDLRPSLERYGSMS